MVFSLRLLFSSILILLLPACANKNLQTYLDSYDSYQDRVYVIDHGLHTGLVIESSRILTSLGLQQTLYNKYRFVEIGRGDAGYYQDPDAKFTTTLAALFYPTPAILHMRGYNRPPDKEYPLSDTLEVAISNIAMQGLVNEVVGSFVMRDGKAVQVARGKDGRSGFFDAIGGYHMFYTCNNWTAEMLKQADYPIEDRFAFFSGSVMRQIEAVQHRLGLACRDIGGYQCAATPEIERMR